MYRNYCKYLLCFFFVILAFTAKGFQSNDSITTVNFLKKVDRVESLSFKVSAPNSAAHRGGNAEAENQTPFEQTFYNYSSAELVKDSLINKGVDASIRFFIFDDEKNFKSIIEYISIVRQNDLYIPNSAATDNNENIIIAANRVAFEPFYDLKSRIFSDIKLVLILSILGLFLFTFLAMLFFIFIVRSKNRKRKAIIKEYKAICQAPLSELLFENTYEEISSMEYETLKSRFSNEHFEKELFINTLIKEIININKNLKGDFKDKLKEIYVILRLDDLSIAKLESKKWEVQSSGIVELYEMNIDYAIGKIQNLISSKNFIVRTNAVRALLHLSKQKDLSFLANQEYPLSRWQQMAFYRVLKNESNNQSMNITSLLESHNSSIRVFGIKLVRLLGKMELIETLSKMFSVASLPEKCEILITFKALTAFGEVDLVHKTLFDPNYKLSALSATLLGHIGNEKSADLLVQRLFEVDDFQLEKNVLTSLYMLDEEKFERTVKEMNKEHIFQIRNHIKDSLLTYV